MSDFTKIEQACIHCGYQLEARVHPKSTVFLQLRHAHNQERECSVIVFAKAPNPKKALQELSR